MSFDKLTLAELNRTADEDFAFELSAEEKKSKKLALAAFAEAELKFSDYLLANPGEAEKYAPAPVVEVPVIPVVEVPVAESPVAPQPQSVVVNNTVGIGGVPQVQTLPYLVKMDRENPYYEIGKYKFTSTDPYQLVEYADVNYVLRQPGFRQARPEEIEEFYK